MLNFGNEIDILYSHRREPNFIYDRGQRIGSALCLLFGGLGGRLFDRPCIIAYTDVRAFVFKGARWNSDSSGAGGSRCDAMCGSTRGVSPKRKRGLKEARVGNLHLYASVDWL